MSSPKKGVAYTFYIGLINSADTGSFVVNPTIAAGDFKVSLGDGAYNPLSTLPEVKPAGSRSVKISLSALEMNDDKIKVQGVDVAGAEWDDVMIVIDATKANVDDVSNKLASGTAQAVAADTITLAAVSNSANGFYNGTRILITGGTLGVDQVRTIKDYNGTSKVATLDRNWTTTPTGTIDYEIQAADSNLTSLAAVVDKLTAFALAIDSTNNRVKSDLDAIKSASAKAQSLHDGITTDDDSMKSNLVAVKGQTEPVDGFGFEGGAVWVDSTNGAAGTSYAVGTKDRPSNNMADALTIAAARSFIKFMLTGGGVENSSVITGKLFEGTNSKNGFRLGGVAVSSCYFRNMRVYHNTTGNNNILENCPIGDANSDFGNGVLLIRCTLSNEVIQLRNNDRHKDCVYRNTELNATNLTTLAEIYGGEGKYIISNLSAGDVVDIYGFDGEVVNDSSNTGGTINRYGGDVYISGSGSATVNHYKYAEEVGLVGLKDNAITSAKHDETTSFSVKSDDSGATQIARTGAGADTLETLSDQIDTIDGIVDLLQDYKLNEKRIEKRSGVHYLVIYDSGGFAGGNEILMKPLKDFDGNNIADLTGTDTPSQELGSIH